MRERFMTWPPWGTAPAASPVRPPCTVTGTAPPGVPSACAVPSPCSSRRVWRTSSSDVGKEMVSASPTVRDSSRTYSSKSEVNGRINDMARTLPLCPRLPETPAPGQTR